MVPRLIYSRVDVQSCQAQQRCEDAPDSGGIGQRRRGSNGPLRWLCGSSIARSPGIYVFSAYVARILARISAEAEMATERDLGIDCHIPSSRSALICHKGEYV